MSRLAPPQVFRVSALMLVLVTCGLAWLGRQETREISATEQRASPVAMSPAHSGADRPAQPSMAGAFGRLSPSFIENRGQLDAHARFSTRRGGMSAYFTDQGLVLQLVSCPPAHASARPIDARHMSDRDELAGSECVAGANLFLTFEEASPNVTVEGTDPLPGRYNYFLGDDPARWRTEVLAYGSIRYRGLYPGVDMVVRDQDGRLEYDLVLEAGADPARIVVRCDGADSIELDDEGSVVLHTAAGAVTQRPPETHEIDLDGGCEPIPCAYRLLGQNLFGFDVPSRKRDSALVIDPGLVFGTFLGGAFDDQVTGIAVDAAGAILATGYTVSSDFPPPPGSPA